MILQVFGLEINIPDMVWTVINFFILFFLLRKFLFNPILRYMDKRNDAVAAGIWAGKNADQRLKYLKEQDKKEINKTKQEARAIIADAGKRSKQISDENILAAKHKADMLKKNLRERIHREEEAKNRKSKESIPEYAALLVGRVFDANGISYDDEILSKYLNEKSEE